MWYHVVLLVMCAVLNCIELSRCVLKSIGLDRSDLYMSFSDFDRILVFIGVN